MEGHSELAQLLAQIEAENIAAHRALHELCSGTTRHTFITARMERLGQLSEQLIAQLGTEQAIPIIVSIMDKHTPDPHQSKQA
jgi:hypothetical protein